MKRFRIDKYIDGRGVEYFRPKRKVLFLYFPIMQTLEINADWFIEFKNYGDAYRYIHERENHILSRMRKSIGEAIKTPLPENYKIETIVQLAGYSLKDAIEIIGNAFADGSCKGSFTMTGSSDDPYNNKIVFKRSFSEDKANLDANYPELDYHTGAIMQIAQELGSSKNKSDFITYLESNLLDLV